MYHITVEMEKRPNGILLTDQAQNIILKSYSQLQLIS